MFRKQVCFFGLTTFTFLIVMSIVYLRERVVFIDIAYHLFEILKSDHLLPNKRFVSYCTQVFPLIGSKLDCSLQVIAMMYSLSFVLLPLIAFLIIFFVFKNSKVALTYLLFLVVMTAHTFYWIQSELPQGMAFMFLFIAMLDIMCSRNTTFISPFILPFLLLVIICFAHPLNIICIFFILGYYFISFPQHRKDVGVLGIIYLGIYAVKSVFFKVAYDNNAMKGLDNIISLFPHYFNIQSNKNLAHYFLRDYYFVLLIFIAIVIFYVLQKKYMHLVLCTLFFGGYIFLVNLNYPNGADQFYLENQYLLLAIFVLIPFVYEILPSMQNKVAQSVIVIVICIVGLVRIQHTHHFYTKRLNWNRSLLAKTESLPNKKLIVAHDFAPKDTLLMTWAFSYEMWLLSTLEQQESRSLAMEDSPSELDWAMSNNKTFISKWGCFDYGTLNRKYFKFNDTSGYKKYP